MNFGEREKVISHSHLAPVLFRLLLHLLLLSVSRLFHAPARGLGKDNNDDAREPLGGLPARPLVSERERERDNDERLSESDAAEDDDATRKLPFPSCSLLFLASFSRVLDLARNLLDFHA